MHKKSRQLEQNNVLSSPSLDVQKYPRIYAVILAISGLTQAACGVPFTSSPDNQGGVDGGGGMGEGGNLGGSGGTGGGKECMPGTEDAQTGDGCSTGLEGICAAGTIACVNGTLECVQDNQPAEIETCDNNWDDNCDGNVNESSLVATAFDTSPTGCRKLITASYNPSAPAGSRYEIVESESTPSAVCSSSPFTGHVMHCDKQVQYHRVAGPCVILDTKADVASVDFKCTVGPVNVNWTLMDVDLEAEGFNEPANVNCDGSKCTYCKPTSCDDPSLPVTAARFEYL